MWTIGDIKTRGKNAFTSNYLSSVIVAFVLSLLITGTAVSSGSQASSTVDEKGIEALLLEADPAVLYALFGVLMSISIIGFILKLFVFNPLQVGGYRFFKKNVEDGNVSIGVLGEGFSGYFRIFITLFLKDLFLFLWTMVFCIPGLIKLYSYRLVPYILKDNPELSATQVITRSRQLMNGYKWKAFVYDISFIGWFILGAIPAVGQLITFFWTSPYKKNSDAALYLEISKNQ